MSQVQYGDAAELERLYGSDFDGTRLKCLGPNQEDLDVSTLLRDRLAHHGYILARDFSSPVWNKFFYQHDDGHEVELAVLQNTKNDTLLWEHRVAGGGDMFMEKGVGSDTLIRRLHSFHSHSS